MVEKIDYAELRKIIRDMHDYIRHPERVQDHDVAKTIALASLPHPLLMAEQLVRERELRMKAERKAIWCQKEGVINSLKVALVESFLSAWSLAAANCRGAEVTE